LLDAFGWDGGGFRDAPTLTEAVCAECNQYFGETIDNHIARDTLEGLYRYRFRVKPAAEFKPRGKRSKLWSWVRSGRWSGAVVWYREFDRVLRPSFAPQVGLGRSFDGPFDYWFTTESLPAMEQMKDLFSQGYRYGEFQGIEGADPEDNTQAIKDLAKEMGLEMSGEPTVTSGVGLTPEQFVIEERWGTTEEFWRGVAKMTLNYLAFQHGPDAALHHRFDPIREHIRFAKPHTFMTGFGGTMTQERRPGHAYLLGVGQYGRSLAVEGRLRLLTGILYGVTLAENVPLLYLEPRSHRYELDTGLVVERARTQFL
jgi:hypothetical protein